MHRRWLDSFGVVRCIVRTYTPQHGLRVPADSSPIFARVDRLVIELTGLTHRYVRVYVILGRQRRASAAEILGGRFQRWLLRVSRIPAFNLGVVCVLN